MKLFGDVIGSIVDDMGNPIGHIVAPASGAGLVFLVLLMWGIIVLGVLVNIAIIFLPMFLVVYGFYRYYKSGKLAWLFVPYLSFGLTALSVAWYIYGPRVQEYIQSLAEPYIAYLELLFGF